MSAKHASGKQPWVDPDDAAELTREWFERAAIYRGGALIRPGKPIADPERIIRLGRPRKETPKQAISLRLDPDVLAGFRAMGSGWQTLMNSVLRAYLSQGKGRGKRARRTGLEVRAVQLVQPVRPVRKRR